MDEMWRKNLDKALLMNPNFPNEVLYPGFFRRRKEKKIKQEYESLPFNIRSKIEEFYLIYLGYFHAYNNELTEKWRRNKITKVEMEQQHIEFSKKYNS